MPKDKVREPMNLNEALSSPEKKSALIQWKELHLIKTNKVWELVKQPEGNKTVGCKWIFKQMMLMAP